VGVQHVANPTLSDVYAQFLPWNAALRWAVEHRQWPLWNPFELCGNVLAAAAQSAPYHPLTLLGVLLPMPEALTFAATATYFIAALGAFLLIRSIQDGPSLGSGPSSTGFAGGTFDERVPFSALAGRRGRI